MEDPVKPKFKVGERVHWTNEQGVDLGIRTVTEVMVRDDGPQRYRITNDTPWMYVREHTLEPAPPEPEPNPQFGSW